MNFFNKIINKLHNCNNHLDFHSRTQWVNEFGVITKEKVEYKCLICNKKIEIKTI